MLDSQIHRHFSPIMDGLAAPLARRGVSATAVTIAGFVAGVAAIVFIISGYYGIGFLLLLLNRLADGLDGAIARRTDETPLGEFLDTMLDYLVIAAVPFAFAVAHQPNAMAASFLLLGFVAWAVTELAFRQMQDRQNAGYPDLDAVRSGSLCGFTEIFILFGLMCLAPAAFSVLCYLYGIVFFVSVGVRVASVVMASDRGSQ